MMKRYTVQNTARNARQSCKSRTLWRRTAKPVCLLLLTAVFVMAFLACSCAQQEDDIVLPTVMVTLMDGDGYRAEKSQVRAVRGGSATFRLDVDEGMSLASCSYGESQIIDEGDCTLLVLYDLRYPVRVSAMTAEADEDVCTIAYDINGGEFTYADTDASVYYASMPMTHKRINTSTAYGIISRPGYTQTGWNTEPDGSGEHTGLGSRVTYEEGLTLYAEWAEWTASDQFSYETEDSGNIRLKGYTGNTDVDALVIPGEIDGCTVDRIGTNFAKKLSVEYLILPPSIEEIEALAFTSCTINNLFFSDTLTDVYNNSFKSGAVHSVHINAVRAPAHLSGNDNSRFADDMDNLMLYSGKPRLLFYAGCSMSYGLKSEMVQEAFPEYQVLDIGVIGGTNAYFQMQIIYQFLHEGDVFVHAPEASSGFQLMYSLDTDSRVFTMIEGNYDLLSYADASEMNLLWVSYSTFISNREELEPGSYADALSTYNDYGDICIERPYDESVGNKSYNQYKYRYYTYMLTDSAFSRLSGMYKDYTAKGVRVLFSFSPMNAAEIYTTTRYSDAMEFEEFYVSRQGEGGYTVISDLLDYHFASRYFYDTDYHLNDEGARLRTMQLIEDLSAVM